MIPDSDTLDQERLRLEAECADHPEDADRRFRLAGVCEALGRPVDAARHFAAVADFRPELAEPRFRLGTALRGIGWADQAIVAYRSALAVDPRHLGSHLALGSLYADRRDGADALDHYRTAVELDPGSHHAHLGQGKVLLAAGDPSGAQAAFEKALRCGAPPGVRFQRDLVLPVISASSEKMRRARVAFEAGLASLEAQTPSLGHPEREAGGPRFFLAYQGENDRNFHERLARLYLAACPDLDWVAPHCREGRPPRAPRRIAFVSRFFFDHSIGRLMQGLLSALAAAGGCEVLLFDTAPVPEDDLRRDLLRHADLVETLTGDLRRQRERIAAAEPDILFYPDIGMDYASYFLAFSRLAPVQCATWGHPVTTGIPSIDYFLSCDMAEPPDAADHYSERLIRLGGLPFSYRRPARPVSIRTRADFGLRPDERVYLLAQNLFKVHPDMDAALRRILETDPGGRLVLIDGHYPDWGSRLGDRFARTLGDVGGRVTFLPRQSHDDFMRLLALADVSLDSFPFSGGNTTYQALAMGTPVVTLPGDYLRGRLSLAILCELGLTDCVAMDGEDYARIAVRLATDTRYATDIARRIEKGAADIFDDPVFLEEAVAFLLGVEPAGATTD